jgi:outer membrane biosynthesis protein TonB
MGRLSASLVVLALGFAAALALVSCGSGDSAELLPGSTASEINSNLDQVEELAGEGDCIGAEDAAAQVSNQVESLSGVDAKLKRTLSEGAARLNEVVVACEETAPEETEETVAPLEEPETEEDEEKEKAPKPEKSKKEPEPSEEAEETDEGPTLPPQSNGKGEEKGGGPPVEPPEPPSGGVGAGAAVGED